eukprot:UN3013
MGGYSIAMTAPPLEFWLEDFVFPLTGSPLPAALVASLLLVGAVFSFAGWLLPPLALFPAQSNFPPLVAWQKAPHPPLFPPGVYRLCRHPGYLGWFLWRVSPQLVLGNPFCFAAYAWVSRRFFADRIPGEEAKLVGFFGEEYIPYAGGVPCGVPFISILP